MFTRLEHLSRQFALIKSPTSVASRRVPGSAMPSSSVATFHLPNTNPPVPITHPASLSQQQLLAFPAFKTWLKTLTHSLRLQQTSMSHPFHQTPYSLRSIEVQSVDFFSSSRPGFLKLKAEVANDNGEHLSGSVFMRGGSVAMLIVLTPSDTPTSGSESSTQATLREEHAILTLQPRIPAGSLSFTEVPAGMLDDSGTFAGAAAREIAEETGLEISSDELLDLTQLTDHLSLNPRPQGEDQRPTEQLQTAVYPSPGGSDEFIPIFLARKSLSRTQIDDLKGKLTGLRDDGEKITLKIVRLDEVWKVAWRDAKALAAIALYQGLRAEGKL